MCRLLAYKGISVPLDRVIAKPEHSLIVQGYQPRQMTAGFINADGFGIGWYHHQQDTEPFTYKHTIPIWNDVNLPHLLRYIESDCLLGYVRSATEGNVVSINNCQPFRDGKLLFIHNGFIHNFRRSLYKPIRDRLHHDIYQAIDGTTDSEHIFALFVNELHHHPELSIAGALHRTLDILRNLAARAHTNLSANIVISDGEQLVASRFAHGTTVPSLYWISDAIAYPNAVLIASEPCFADNWRICPEQSIITVSSQLEVNTYPV
jgi:glutamine amidotransferase